MLKESRSLCCASEPIGPFSQKTNAAVDFLSRSKYLLCAGTGVALHLVVCLFFFETKSYYIAPIDLVFVTYSNLTPNSWQPSSPSVLSAGIAGLRHYLS